MTPDSRHRCSTGRRVMVSKCANPACLALFRYLHEGRIFTVRNARPSHRSDGADPNVERYWLCSTCSDKLTLVLQNGKVTLRALAEIGEVGVRLPRAVSREGPRASRSVA